MRRWPLALLVTLASPALAQAPEPTAADPAPAPPSAAPAPAPAPEPQAAPEAPATPAVETPAPPAAAAPAPAKEEAKPAPAAPTPAPTPAPAASTPAPTPAPAPVRAQKPPAPAPAPAPVATPTPAPAPAPVAAPTPAPAPVAAAPVDGKESLDPEQVTRTRVKSEARFIFENLLLADTRSFAGELLYPFQLEEKRYNTAEELVAAWVKQLRQKRTDLVSLYDIEVLSLAEMEKKYGKAPARLGIGTLKDADLYAAIGNLSGRAAVLLFRAPKGSTPRAFAYTD